MSEEFEEIEGVEGVEDGHQIDLQKFEKAEEDDFENQIEIAESIYEKMRRYIEFHSLNLLDLSPSQCISNLIPFIK